MLPTGLKIETEIQVKSQEEILEKLERERERERESDPILMMEASSYNLQTP